MKYFIVLLITLTLNMGVQATEPYQHTGKVISQSADANHLVIDNIDYRIDNDTQVKNSIVRRGELGPMLNIGQMLGFNVERQIGTVPYITEIWVLD
ncbi:MAG: hypothetical protein P1P93_09890 [Gammaproteobacteria bacterium]|nr:hypothetical protein [Gammaproteobacteria bacterium]